MQNVDLGHTKVMQIRQGETLSHQGAITHEVCCLAAELHLFKIIQALRSNTWIGSVLKALLLFTFDNDYAFFMAELWNMLRFAIACVSSLKIIFYFYQWCTYVSRYGIVIGLIGFSIRYHLRIFQQLPHQTLGSSLKKIRRIRMIFYIENWL